jgi:transposase
MVVLITATLPAALAMEITAIDGREQGTVTIGLASGRASVACPACGAPARRVHSRYQRTLADLPWQGLAVQLSLATRRFFCDAVGCARRIFAESFPGLVAAHGRRSTRLARLFSAIGVALGGEVGARLVADLGVTISPDTLLRLVRAGDAPASGPVRVLGVDDWARRRGQSYGTILIDLERHAVVDLLPDREAATLSAWLQAHPEVQIISRDRASAYAEGARSGAPQAEQVADRWHLLKNVGDALERLLQGQPEAVRAAAQSEMLPAAAEALPRADTSTSGGPAFPAPPPACRQRPSDGRRMERYTQVQELAAAGYGVRAIGRETGLSRPTVRKYLRASDCPVPAPRPGLLSPGSRWERLLRERWDAGCQNAHVLWTELCKAGFPGSAGTVRRHIGGWRPEPGRRGRPPARPTDAQTAPAPPPAPSPRQVKWWLLRESAELSDEQQAYLDRLLLAASQLKTAQRLAHAFGRLVRERDRAAFADWLAQAEQSGIAELRAIAVGMRRDRAAIEAALRLPWSQGQTEGQVTRLKLVKRQMYGRGGLDLLRARLRRPA